MIKIIMTILLGGIFIVPLNKVEQKEEFPILTITYTLNETGNVPLRSIKWVSPYIAKDYCEMLHWAIEDLFNEYQDTCKIREKNHDIKKM